MEAGPLNVVIKEDSVVVAVREGEAVNDVPVMPRPECLRSGDPTQADVAQAGGGKPCRAACHGCLALVLAVATRGTFLVLLG